MARPYWVVREIGASGLYVSACEFRDGECNTVWCGTRGDAFKLHTLRAAMALVAATSIGHAMVTRAVRVVRKVRS